MKYFTDAVTTVFPDNRVIVFLGVFLDYITDVAKGCARFDLVDAFVKTFLGHLYQACCVGGYIAYLYHNAGVPVEAILDNGDVDIDDVAIFEFFGV